MILKIILRILYIMILNFENIKQNFYVPKEIRYKYGEINTPFFLINNMLNLIPSIDFQDKNKKWLDIGSGNGYFAIVLFYKLFNGLVDSINEPEERKNHIIQNMIYMSEIRPENWEKIYYYFGENCNLFKGDFISHNILQQFDFIIGNPPYNSNGIKKVPTNDIIDKKLDGKTIWVQFIKKSIELLKINGKMVVIIPSIWLKEDKAKMHNLMLQYKIEKIFCMNNTETNQIFNKYAQTPTCYFLFTKINNPGYVTIYDKDTQKYIKWNISIGKNTSIPVFGSSILQKINNHLSYQNYLQVYKTNLPNKSLVFKEINDTNYIYPNVKTCKLNNLSPSLIIEYSNIPQQYYGIPKIIMAHKMYGFPFIDYSGNYGICNRDNYVILKEDKTIEELELLRDFFSTKTALYLFETTRYRMKFLEKYIFELIPDITKISDFPKIINDNTIANYFNFDENDIYNINKLHKKNYTFFL